MTANTVWMRATTALVAIGLSVVAAWAQSPRPLRLATTTSTADTGLLKALLPPFEATCACVVEVVAVGTGQAIEIGRRGDADVLLVHARQAEDQFVAERHSRARHDVMYNDFVMVGPYGDPAKIASLRSARDAFAAIAAAGAPFVSRGDRSGTEMAEKAIWAAASISPAKASWYRSVGQGMGETLHTANEMAAYTLSDRATWLSMRARVPALTQLLGGRTLAENPDTSLRNQYGVMAVNPDTHPGVNVAAATKFVEWLLSRETQRAIGEFGAKEFGQPLFYPNGDDPRTTREVTVVSGTARRTLTLADLRALPRVTIPRYAIAGVKMGPIGVHDWTGASLKEILLLVDPGLASAGHAGNRVVVGSSDGWTATVWWDELFASLPAGESLYNAKGCSECHGLRGEGTARAGRPPVPALAPTTVGVDKALARLRAGGDTHGGINPYTDAQLRRPEFETMWQWLRRPADAKTVAPARAAKAAPVLLAYERDGQPLDGRDGLLQLVVGADEFAGRYAHWVSTITIVP